MTNQARPIICSFYQLSFALQSLHQWNKADIDRLYDVYRMGAPTPTSRVAHPEIFDERKVQAGNVEHRIVFPNTLAAWIQDVCARKGIAASQIDIYRAVVKVRQGLDGDINELMRHAR